jgi:uncharacterized membrane protein YebE (DUF533 family)
MRKLEKALISAAKRDGLLAVSECDRVRNFIASASDDRLDGLLAVLLAELRARRRTGK